MFDIYAERRWSGAVRAVGSPESANFSHRPPKCPVHPTLARRARLGAPPERRPARRADLLPVLARGFRINLPGMGPSGDRNELPNHRIPLLSVHQGPVSWRFTRKQIMHAAEIQGRGLDATELEAIEWVSRLATDDEFRLGM